MTNTNTAATVNAAINNELERLQSLERTEFVGRLVTLEINEDTVRVFDEHPDFNGIPMDIYNGLTRVVGLPTGIVPAVAAEFIDEHAELIARIQRGLSREWDGSNAIGVLTDDAREALDKLDSAATWMTENAYRLWENCDVIDAVDASEYYAPIRRELESAESVHAAVRLALESLDDDGVADFGNGLVWIDPEEAARYAADLWKEQNVVDDE